LPSQELVSLVKDLKGQVSDLTSLRDELKTYCHALDFSEAVALNKLRGVLERHTVVKLQKRPSWRRYGSGWLIPSGADAPWTYVPLYLPPSPRKPNWKPTNWSADTNEQPGPLTRTADLPVLGASGAKGVQEVPMAVAIPAGIQGTTLGIAQNDVHDQPPPKKPKVE